MELMLLPQPKRMEYNEGELLLCRETRIQPVGDALVDVSIQTRFDAELLQAEIKK